MKEFIAALKPNYSWLANMLEQDDNNNNNYIDNCNVEKHGEKLIDCPSKIL